MAGSAGKVAVPTLPPGDCLSLPPDLKCLWFFNSYSFSLSPLLCSLLFLCFPFLLIYIHFRLFFPFFFFPFSSFTPHPHSHFWSAFFSLWLGSLCPSPSRPLSLMPGIVQVSRPLLFLSFQHRRWNWPLWQRKQKLQVPAQVTRTAISLFRGF